MRAFIAWRNALLTKIAAGGAADGYSDPAAGATRWEGSVGIYVDNSRQTLTSFQRTDELDVDRLEVPLSENGEAIGSLARRGDIVTYTYRGEEQTRRVQTLVSGDPLLRQRILLEDL